MASPLRVLFFDIETAPLLAYVWRTFKENVSPSQVEKPSFVLCWAARWMGEEQMITASLSTSEVKRQDDRRIVEKLAKLIRSADMIVAHNVNGFDLPVINGRVMKHGLEPLGPVRTLDTLKLSRQNFRLAHHKLDALGDFLGVGRKVKVDFDLWREVYQGSAAAMSEMLEYNEQDVELLEKVFDAMRPHVRNLPRLFDAGQENEHACPSCGTANEFQRRGFYRTQSGNFVKVQCKVCGRYSRFRSGSRLHKLDVHPL